MKGYPSIGTIYLYKLDGKFSNSLCAVVQNDSNDKTSTLMVVEDSQDYGKEVKMNVSEVLMLEPILCIPAKGRIVEKNGIEFIDFDDEHTLKRENK